MQFGGFFDPLKLQEQIAELERQSALPDLWNNPDDARAILRRKAALERELNEFNSMDAENRSLNELYAIAPDDAEVLESIEKLAEKSEAAKSSEPTAAASSDVIMADDDADLAKVCEMTTLPQTPAGKSTTTYT